MNSALYVAISTLTGHSPLQPLHERHRCNASKTCGSRHPLLIGLPCSISKSRRARPRVLCISSLVAMKLGHIVPPLVRRHFPTPTHRMVACEKLKLSSG